MIISSRQIFARLQDENLSVKNCRFLYQGKQISQLIAFVWRWADPCPANLSEDSEDQNKIDAAQDLLKNYFLYHTEQQQEKVYSPPTKLIDLFAADPRGWPGSYDSEYKLSHEAELLVTVFGETRIKDENVYLSPMFNEQELGIGDCKDIPHYKFILDPSIFMGYLNDAFLHYSDGAPRFDYHIPFPPCPKFGPLTLTTHDLDDWIENDDTKEILPKNIFIPSSTS